MRRLGVKRIAGLEVVCTCQILQLLGCFLTTYALFWLLNRFLIAPISVACDDGFVKNR
jgi:hypothetical protein